MVLELTRNFSGNQHVNSTVPSHCLKLQQQGSKRPVDPGSSALHQSL